MLAGIVAFLLVWILLRLLLAITDLSRIQTSAAIRAGGVICIHQCRLRCCRLLQQTTAQTKQAAARRSPNHGLISSLETAPRNINPRNPRAQTEPKAARSTPLFSQSSSGISTKSSSGTGAIRSGPARFFLRQSAVWFAMAITSMSSLLSSTPLKTTPPVLHYRSHLRHCIDAIEPAPAQ